MLLIGHGTSLDGDEAKFNLVGPAELELERDSLRCTICPDGWCS